MFDHVHGGILAVVRRPYAPRRIRRGLIRALGDRHVIAVSVGVQDERND